MISLIALAALQAAAPAALTKQQLFDRGEAALDRQEWSAAAADFTRVLAGMKPSRSAALIRIRLAEALTRLGRADEARAAAQAGVDALKAGPADAELARGWLALGDAARFDLAYSQAIAAYRAAEALGGVDPNGGVARSARVGLMLAGAVVEPETAARAGDAVLGDATFMAGLTKDEQARYQAIRARIELMRGDGKAALPFIRRAIALHGPVTPRVSYSDIGVRGDAALVYRAAGDMEQARRFLTYSGAGHLPEMGWLSGGDMTLPVCDAAVRPEDSAVVEFAISDKGRVTGTAPVWASRPGEMAVAFAEAVRGWRLSPEAAAKLNPLWRASVRLQLRCVTRPEPASIGKPFRDAQGAWIARWGEPDPASGEFTINDAALPPALSAAGARAGRADGPAEWRAAAAALDKEAQAAGAPLEARAALLGGFAGRRKASASARAERFLAVVPLVEGDAGGARAAAWLRTEAAILLEGAGRFDAAAPLLDQAMAVPIAAMPADDPVRVVATLHRSIIDRRAGEHAAAEARLMKTGLTAEQCALYDVKPVATNAALSSANFPGEAVRWGFEGYVRESFDVNPDGSVRDVRTVIAYPPFVFADATERAVKRFRYAAPTLGGKTLGCAAETLNVRFALPR